MRTTLDIPESLLRQVKALAALKGQTMKVFFIEALTEKLQVESRSVMNTAQPVWMKYVGSAPKDAQKEIDAIVEREFSEVNPKDWE